MSRATANAYELIALMSPRDRLAELRAVSLRACRGLPRWALLFALTLCVACDSADEPDDKVTVAEANASVAEEPADTFTECTLDGSFFKVARANGPVEIDAQFNQLTECVSREHVGVACGRLRALPTTHVCVFRTQRDMNLSLYRASHAIEIEPVVLADDELREHEGYDGHDLTGESLARFLEQFNAAKASYDDSGARDEDDAIGGVAVEEEFWELYVEPALEPGMILIAGFLRDDVDMIISHELYHAQFFSDLDYQEAVIAFWDEELGKMDDGLGKNAIEAAIAQAYDIARNPLLLYNEFQAYALQLPLRSGEHDLIAMMQPYKKRLTEYLVDRGVAPLKFAPPPGPWASVEAQPSPR